MWSFHSSWTLSDTPVSCSLFRAVVEAVNPKRKARKGQRSLKSPMFSSNMPSLMYCICLVSRTYFPLKLDARCSVLKLCLKLRVITRCVTNGYQTFRRLPPPFLSPVPPLSGLPPCPILRLCAARVHNRMMTPNRKRRPTMDVFGQVKEARPEELRAARVISNFEGLDHQETKRVKRTHKHSAADPAARLKVHHLPGQRNCLINAHQ